MKSDLKETIESYELEKQQLEKQMAEYIDNGDYLYAHHHNRALKKINQTLRKLKDMQNPMSRHMDELQMKMEHYRKMLAQPNFSNNEYLKQYTTGLEVKIRQLQDATIKPLYDSQETDDAIFGLANGNIKHFRLHFKSTPDVYVAFTLEDQAIKMRIGYEFTEEHAEQYIFEHANKLKSLGFSLNSEHWIYLYQLSRFKDALDIKIVLARLIYDVFQYDRRYDTASIDFC